MTAEMANIAAAIQKRPMTTSELTVYILRARDKKRAVRKRVAALMREGYPIVNLQDGVGYRWTNDLTLMKKFYHQERSRAIERLKSIKQTYLKIKEEEAKKK